MPLETQFMREFCTRPRRAIPTMSGFGTADLDLSVSAGASVGGGRYHMRETAPASRFEGSKICTMTTSNIALERT
jgi:hypothetical protein